MRALEPSNEGDHSWRGDGAALQPVEFRICYRRTRLAFRVRSMLTPCLQWLLDWPGSVSVVIVKTHDLLWL